LPAKLTMLQHGTQKKVRSASSGGSNGPPLISYHTLWRQFTDASDARVNRITESIAGLRIAKMFGIEANVKRSVLACPFAL
jgi:hypothetical protein